METHDLIIIGSGPAGYTAAVYAARANLKPLVFAGEKAGGQLMWTTVVENFPGFPEGVDGPQLMKNMMQQATRFGASIEYRDVSRVDFSDPHVKKLYTIKKGVEVEYLAKTVIISTGAESIRLGIPGEDALFGRGVATCAVCDAAFYKDKIAAVIGGGDSAMEDTLALTKFAKSVIVIHRKSEFRASKIMQDRVLSNPKVSVMWNSIVEEAVGDQNLEQVRVNQNGESKLVEVDGMFLAVGHRPMTNLFRDQIELDKHGYVVTRQSFSQAGLKLAQGALKEGLVQFPSMTSVDGVFAAGDVVDVRYKQAITSAGQGCMAALDVEKWLGSQSL